MALHPLATQFASITDAYERGRPEYSPAAAGAIVGQLGLRSGDPVLDLAAGTGKLTRALLAVGLDVIAIEPQPELREVLAASIGAERVRAGVAEAIPLPDDSVRAVTAGAAFHWFEQPAAIAEIERVLAPGGGICVCENHPDWSAEPWAGEITALVFDNRPEHPHFDGPPWHEALHGRGWEEPREIRVTTTTPWAPGQTIDFLRSMSWVSAMAAERREPMLEQVAELIRRSGEPQRLPLHATLHVASRR